MSTIGLILLGLISAFFASKVVNHTGKGLFMDMVLGVAGAMVGSVVLGLVGRTGAAGLNLSIVFASVIGAVLALVVYHAVSGRQSHA